MPTSVTNLESTGLVLAFANTKRRDADLLGTAASAERWILDHTLLGSQVVEPVSDSGLQRLLDLRRGIRTLFLKFSDSTSAEREDALDLVNLRLGADPVVALLHQDGSVALTRRGDAPRHIERLVLDSVIALAVDPGLGSVRQCAAPDCELFFVSTTARRKWCSSATCGNRERVRRHYRGRAARAARAPRTSTLD